MQAGQTYRARSGGGAVAVTCTPERKSAGRSLSLRLRAPDRAGHLGLGRLERRAIPLPAAVCAYLEAGRHAAGPHLAGDRVTRMAAASRCSISSWTCPPSTVPPSASERRVLGFDWGVRSLITASVLETSLGQQPARQVSRPVFLDTGGIDGRPGPPAPRNRPPQSLPRALRDTLSPRRLPPTPSSRPRCLSTLRAGRRGCAPMTPASARAGRSTPGATANWPTWQPIC